MPDDPGHFAQGLAEKLEEDDMTIKEITELCGVDRRTVERWAHKVSDDPGHFAQGLAEKLMEAEKSGKAPADFTLEETLAVIGEGGGNKVLVSLLAENAANKNALVKGSYAAKRYAKRIRPAAEAAGKVYELQEKYQYTDKVSKQDTADLFKYAVMLKHYFYDSATINNELVLGNMFMEEKLLGACRRLGISPDDVPASWLEDESEWPDFPELPAPSPAPLAES
jgi:hypothetical protein